MNAALSVEVDISQVKPRVSLPSPSTTSRLSSRLMRCPICLSGSVLPCPIWVGIRSVDGIGIQRDGMPVLRAFRADTASEVLRARFPKGPPAVRWRARGWRGPSRRPRPREFLKPNPTYPWGGGVQLEPLFQPASCLLVGGGVVKKFPDRNAARYVGRSTEVGIARRKAGVAVARSVRDYAQGAQCLPILFGAMTK